MRLIGSLNVKDGCDIGGKNIMNNIRILSMLKTAVSSAVLVLIASSSVAATADESVINYNYIEGAIEYSDTDENSTDVERLTVSYGAQLQRDS